MTVDQRRETTIIFRRHPPRPLRLNQYGLKHAGVHITGYLASLDTELLGQVREAIGRD